MRHPIQITQPTEEFLTDLNLYLIKSLKKKNIKFGIYKTKRGHCLCRELLEKDIDKFKHYINGHIVKYTRKELEEGIQLDNIDFMLILKN